jgi:hypothetical protein
MSHVTDAERRAQLDRIRKERRAQEEAAWKPSRRVESLEFTPLVGSLDTRISEQADELLEAMFGDEEEDEEEEAERELEQVHEQLEEDAPPAVQQQEEEVEEVDEVEEEGESASPPPKRTLPTLPQKSPPSAAVAAPVWKAEDEVEAVWLVDEVFYVARIVRDEGNDLYEVLFIEYGNRQPHTPGSLIRPLTPEEQLHDMGLATSSSSFSADDMNAADWKILADAVLQGLKVRDFVVGDELLRRVFDGYAAVTWLVEHAAELCPGIATRLDALRVYQRLLVEGRIAAVQQPEEGEGLFFTDGGVLFVVVVSRPSPAAVVAEREKSPPLSPKTLMRHDTLEDVRSYLEEEIDGGNNSEMLESGEETDDDEDLIMSVVIERKQTLMALPAAKRLEQENSLKRIQSSSQQEGGWHKAAVSSASRLAEEAASVGGASAVIRNAERVPSRAENRKSHTEGRLQQMRPKIPEFVVPPPASAYPGSGSTSPHSPKQQPLPLPKHHPSSPKGVAMTDSRTNSPQLSPRRESPRSQVSPRSIGHAQSPRQAVPASPQGSPRPQVAIRELTAPSSPRPTNSVRAPLSPPRRHPPPSSAPPPAVPPLPPQTPFVPPSPQLSPLRGPPQIPPPPPIGSISIHSGSAPVRSSPPPVATVWPASPLRAGSQPQPPSHQPRDPYLLSRNGFNSSSSGSLPRSSAVSTQPPPPPQVRPSNLPPRNAPVQTSFAPRHQQQLQPQMPLSPAPSFLGIAVIGQSFVAQREEQLSVVAGTTVMIMARPTKNWLVASVGASVGAIPVTCVKYFTPTPRDGPVAAGRGAGRGRGVGRGAGRRL